MDKGAFTVGGRYAWHVQWRSRRVTKALPHDVTLSEAKGLGLWLTEALGVTEH